MDNIWHCDVNKHLHKKGLAPKGIHADVVATSGDTSPLYATVKRRIAHFKMGKESLEYNDSCGSN